MAAETAAPKSVQVAATEDISPKSRLVTTLLAWILGGLGIDRFYTGHVMLGVVKLVTAGGFGFWWVIDFIMAVAGKRKDKEGKLIAKW